MRARPAVVAAAAASLVALGVALTPDALGYAIEVHKDFYDLSFVTPTGSPLEAPTTDDLAAFRRFVWERARALNAEFARRWPTPASFDAAAFKALLQLNPSKTVVAIDTVPSRPRDARSVVREGSVDPDNDDRNQDRLFVENGRVVLDAFGRAVPEDPRTTWFGGLTGIPSQFDAHGATLRTGKKGGGMLTAFRSPEQFARPPVSLGSAPEFSQTYTDLAMLARLRGGRASEWLALTYAGNALHGLEDLGNQIHCTVLGAPEFFVDGYLTSIKGKLKNMLKRRHQLPAGFVPPAALTPDQVNQATALIRAGHVDQVAPEVRFALNQEPKGTPDVTEIGIRIIGNHHRLLEDFVESQTLAGMRSLAAGRPDLVPAQVRDVLEGARRGDAAFEARVRATLAANGLGSSPPGATEAARVLGEVMIEHSAPEAVTIYRAIRKISRKGLKREEVYDAQLGHDPLQYVTTTKGPEVDTIWRLTGAAFARVVTTLRVHDEVTRAETGSAAPGSPEALVIADRIVERLVGRQLAAIDAARARRDAHLAEKVAEKAEADAPKKGLWQKVKRLFGQ